MTQRHLLAAVTSCVGVISTLAISAAPVDAAVPGEPGRLVFIRSTFLGDDFRNDMFTARPDGSRVKRITHRREGPFDPRWAPYGNRIVYDGRSASRDRPGIWVMNANGGAKQRVIGRRGSNADWAPGGGELVYVRATRLGHQRLHIYSFATGESHPVDVESDVYAESPTWSADGQRIAFTGSDDSDEDGLADLYTVRTDGTDLTQVTNTPSLWEERVDWSPRGGRLLYGTYSINNDCTALHTIRPDGTDHRRLRAAGCSAMEPVWSPGGRRIAAFRVTARGSGVWVMSRDGSPRHFAVDGYLADWQPRRR
jgi:TolB protein